MNNLELVIVIPTYNEGYNLKTVLEEWYLEITKLGISDYQFYLVNDGSTDDTVRLALEAEIPEGKLRIFEKPNSGHGLSCIWGYKRALEHKANWILQIDSDYQCDPSFFGIFWNKRKSHDVLYGFRKIRGDGFLRLLISRSITFIIFACTFKYSKDPNVPYRLFSNKSLTCAIDFDYQENLSNMLLTYRIQNFYKIHWVDIKFRKRIRGNSSQKIIFSIFSVLKIILILKN